jgi:hypothetical protein
MICSHRAGVGRVVALARNEINTDKCLKWVGFEDTGIRVSYRTGTQSSLLLFQKPSEAARQFVEQHMTDFEEGLHFGPGFPETWREWVGNFKQQAPSESSLSV